MRRWLPILALLAVPACTASGPMLGTAPGAAPQRQSLGQSLGQSLAETPASRRGGGARLLAWEGTGRGCGRSVFDNPAMAQRLMAATLAEGPRGVEAPDIACAPGSRAL